MPILTLSGAFTLLMISGYIDLSVGSAMSLSAVVFALMILQRVSASLLALPLTLVLGVAFGLLNGLLVMKLRITPVIATLVTLNLFKGIALLIVPDGLSAIKSAPGTPHARVDQRLRAHGGGARPALGLLRRGPRHRDPGGRRRAGRSLANTPRPSAETGRPPSCPGINAVKWVWLLYIIVGFFAALAGVARASYMSLGDPLSGDGMELDCIIAVLLGGTAFSGGEGSVAKTVVGALIIMCVTTGLMTVIPAFWQVIAKGSVLLIAVVLNHLLVRTRKQV